MNLKNFADEKLISLYLFFFLLKTFSVYYFLKIFIWLNVFFFFGEVTNLEKYLHEKKKIEETTNLNEKQKDVINKFKDSRFLKRIKYINLIYEVSID